MTGSRGLFAATMGLVFLTSQAWAADAVVVEARGAALKAGQVIDDTQKLTLQRGDEVTLRDDGKRGRRT